MVRYTQCVSLWSLGYLFGLLLLSGCKEETKWVERYATDIVNVHVAPSDTSEVITFYNKGEKLLVMESEKSEWAKVKLDDDRVGYVRKTLLSLVEPPEEEPLVDTVAVEKNLSSTGEFPEGKSVGDTTGRGGGVASRKDTVIYSEEGELPVPLPIKKKQKEPSKLAQFAAKRIGSIKTYGTDLQDQTVSLSEQLEWRDELKQYLGTYMAGLGAQVTSIELTRIEEYWLKGELYYQMEQVNDIGLIETKTGKAPIRFRITNEGVIVGTEGPIRVITADFVQWDEKKGILLHLVSQENPFVLLTKTK